MNNEPKDTFWSIVTVPFRLLGILLVSVIATPLIVLRKIWCPHIPADMYIKQAYLFIRYGDYKNNGEYWN